MREQLINADQQGQLIAKLCEIYLSDCETSVIAQMVSELNNNGKIRLLDSTNVEAVKNLEHNDYWSVQDILSKAIPILNCKTSVLLSFVKTLVERAGNDGAAYTPVSALTKWCNKNPKQAYEILEGARQSDELCLLYCVSALKGLSDFEQMGDFADSDDVVLSRLGVRAMGISSSELSEPSAKEALDKCFEILGVSDDNETRLTAIDTAFRVWNDNKDVGLYLQSEIIKTIIDAAIEGERQKVLSCLFYQVDGLSGQSITSILKYATLPSEDPVTLLRVFDHALHGFDGRWPFEVVVEIYDQHVPSLPGDFDVRHLHHFFDLVWKDPIKISYVFSSWLNRGDFQQCSLLADAVGEHRDENLNIDLLKEHLPTMTNDQTFLARKCLGFFWVKEVVAASILLSMLKHTTKAARAAIEELLFNPLLLSYGGDLRKYFESQKTNKSKRISESVKNLLIKHDNYLVDLQTPDELVEFYPSTEQRRAVAVKDHQRNRDIQKQAHARSIFADIVSTEILLYGRGSFTTIHHGDGKTSSSVMQMQEMSFSTEMPRLMVVDPAGFHQMLTMFRIEKRISR